MESWQRWEDFLKISSRDYDLTDAETESFLLQFARQNLGKSLKEISEQLPLMEDRLGNHKKRMSEVYRNFSKSCVELKSKTPNKSKPLQEWLETEYSQWLSVQDSDSALSSATTETPIYWRNICLAMLEAEKPLTTNALMRDEDDRFELEEIHVPLALVERKKPNLIGGDTQAEQGSRLYEPEYEEKQRFEHEQFLRDILKDGKGKQNGKRIAIIGEPGAGKTTLLRKIAFWVHKENTEILPISISLADLPETNPKQEFLEQFLLDKWLKAALPYISLEIVEVTEALKTEFKKLCNQGRVWLLLDGVDEMSVQGEERLWAISNQLKGWVGQARVVLTCRLNVWEANRNVLADNFEIYRTLDFSYGDSTTPDRVEEFIAKWFNKTPNLGQQLRQELDKPGKERIKDLVKNPLRLALLCSTWNLWRDRGGLPDTKAKLYQGFVEKFYDWKGREFPTNSSQREQLNRALGELAKLAIDQPTSRFRLKHSWVCEVLGKPDEGLFELALQLGWLNEVGLAAESPDERVYAFWHPTFEEYFAALAVDDWNDFLPRNHVDSPVYGKRYRIFEPQWKEVILLWLGRHEEQLREPKKEFIKALVEFDNGIEPPFYSYRAIFLAAAGIAEFTDDYWVSQIVPRIVALSFGVFNSEQERWMFPLEPLAEVAKFALLETERTKTIDILLDLIKKSNQEDVYLQILTILKKIGRGNLKIIDFLETNIAKIKNKDLRTMVAETLGEINIGNETAISNIIEIIKISLKPVSIEFIASKLQIIGINNTLCINSLEELLKDKSQSKEFQRIIGTALWSIDKSNQTAITLLVNLAKDTQYSDRWRTFEILSQILAHTNNEEIISTLQSIVRNNDDKDEFAKILALKILLLIPDINENIFNDLINLVQGTAKSYIQDEAIKILNILAYEKNEKVLRILEEFLGSKNDYLRYISAYTICNIEKNKAIAITTLEDLIMNATDNKIRCQAAYCLAENNKNSKVALTILEEFAQKRSFDDNFRSSAAIYLIKLFPSNDVAIKTLEELSTNSPNELIRIYAAINLGYFQIENSTAIESLFWIAKNSQCKFIQGMATKKLGDLGLITKLKLRVINTLVDLLRSNKSGTVCTNAADGLKSFLNLETRKLVIAHLKDYISKQTLTNDFGRFYYCYEILWHCAQNMPYPDFYQAWHQDTLTNSATANVNSANLPQLLAEAINNQPDLCSQVKLLCIDSHPFIESENPAPEIYDQMLNQNCPEWQNGYPDTMQKLKLYWNSLRRQSEIPLFFICYDSTALSATPTGFSDSFLKAFSKFDRAICVVCEQSDIPLPTFSPSQPDLVAAVVAWIRRSILENRHPI